MLNSAQEMPKDLTKVDFANVADKLNFDANYPAMRQQFYNDVEQYIPGKINKLIFRWGRKRLLTGLQDLIEAKGDGKC